MGTPKAAAAGEEPGHDRRAKRTRLSRGWRLRRNGWRPDQIDDSRRCSDHEHDSSGAGGFSESATLYEEEGAVKPAKAAAAC